MHLKIELDHEAANKVLRHLIEYELRVCKSIVEMGSEHQKRFYDCYTPELAAALNMVLTHFGGSKKKKYKKSEK